MIKSPDVFLERVEREQPDVIFIRPGKSDIPGLKIAQMAKAMDFGIKIVFLSEESDYPVDAYELGAFGYLLCPVEKRKLDSVFSKLI